MATRRRKKSGKRTGIKRADGSCKFGKVKSGPRKGQCLKQKRRRKAA